VGERELLAANLFHQTSKLVGSIRFALCTQLHPVKFSVETLRVFDPIVHADKSKEPPLQTREGPREGARASDPDCVNDSPKVLRSVPVSHESNRDASKKKSRGRIRVFARVGRSSTSS